MKSKITTYAGLIIIVLAALFMLIVFIIDSVNNTTLAIAGGFGIVGLLVQVFVGRSVDY